MAKKPLIIKEIAIRKIPGFPSGMAVIEGLAKNINLVAGPNASGKSSMARAIHQILWPQNIQRVHLECRLELEKQKWDIKIDHGEYLSQREGIIEKLPQLPALEESKRYSLALHELVKDDDTELATQVVREVMGGYNLSKAEGILGFDAKIKPRTISQYKSYAESEQKVREIENNQSLLKDRENKLENLQSERGKAVQARIWETLLTSAISYLEAKQAFEDLNAQLKLYPVHLSGMGGNEYAELQALENDIVGFEKNVEHALAETNEKNEQLNALGLPDAGISKQVLDELDIRISSLLDTEKQLNILDVEIAKGEQACDDALKLISKELELGREIEIDLKDVTRLEKFLLNAYNILSEKQLLETTISAQKLKIKEETLDVTVLGEGIRLLILWFKEPQGGNRISKTWLWALVITGVLSPFAVYFFGWPGLLGSVLLVGMAWLVSQDNTAAQVKIREADYSRTGLKQPETWESEQVLKLFEELNAQLQVEKNSTLIRQEIILQEVELEKISKNLLTVEQQRDTLLKELSFIPELSIGDDIKNYSGLYWCLTYLVKYQIVYAELAGYRLNEQKTNEQQDANLKQINNLLKGLHEPVTDGAKARAGYKKLNDDEVTRQRLVEGIMGLKDRITEWEGQKRRSLQKLNDLYQNLGIDEGNKEEVRLLVDKLEAYKIAAKSCEEKEFDFKSKNALLEGHEWFEKIKGELDSMGIETAKLKYQEHKLEAEKLEGLNEQITSSQTLIRQAKEGHILENALAAREAALKELEDVYQNNLSSMTGNLISRKLKQISREHNGSAVFERANQLFNRITNGRYELLLDEGDNIAFKAYDTVNCQGQELGILSTGTRIQLLLSVRLAFIESQEMDIKLPVIADEILANSDDQRAQQIIEALVEISKEGRQVFYFTSQTDEIGKWQNYQSSDPDLEIALITLNGQKNEYINYRSEPKIVFPSLLFNDHPKPGNLSRREYADLLNLPTFNLLTDKAEQMHLWYLVDDLNVLYECLQKGIKSYGQLESFLKHKGKIEQLTEPLWISVQEKISLLAFYQELFAQGRAKPIERQILIESGCISGTFIDSVTAKLLELNNDPQKLVEALKIGAISRFNKSKADDLENYFLNQGYLDGKTPLISDELLLRTQAFLSNHELDKEEANRFLESILITNPVVLHP